MLRRLKTSEERPWAWVVLAAILVWFCAACASPKNMDPAVEEAAAAELHGIEVLPPSGPFTVGTMVLPWVDSDRFERATEDPEDRRHLTVQLWYPAAAGADPRQGPAFPFFPDLEAYRAAFGEDYPESLGTIRTQSVLEATGAEGSFPVILFFHGWNSQRVAYSGFLQELASHGFVVVGIDQPFAGRVLLPSGEVTPSRDDYFTSAEDLLTTYGDDGRFVLKMLRLVNEGGAKLAGRLLLDRVLTIGHSNGAIAAVATSFSEPAVRAVMAVDSFDRDIEPVFRLDRPLVLLRTGGAKAPSEAYEESLIAPVYDLEVAGGGHLSVTDASYLDAPAEERAAAESVHRRIRQVAVAIIESLLKSEQGTLDADSLPAEGVTLRALPPTGSDRSR